ncbi:PHP domain-containing protein, partial [Caballeronia grimmiae]|uniref:PHP domain-containing protein n=1 Tax=Caballeronia grimmiae TaxID=1071679 RepID=UPI0012682321
MHGASHGEELVLRASQLGYAGLAITDECSVAGVVRAHVQAKEEKLPLIIGSYFRLVHARQGADSGPKKRPAFGHTSSPAFGLILLAQNREGYGNLCELITLARRRAAKGSYLLTPDDLAHPETEYAHLKGVQNCLAILVPDFPANEATLTAQVDWLRETFPARAWVGLTLH